MNGKSKSPVWSAGKRLAMVGLASVAAVALSLHWTAEPKFQGRSLSAWLAALDDDEAGWSVTWSVDPPVPPITPTREQHEASEAVRHMGAKALPHLLSMLQTREGLSEGLDYWSDRLLSRAFVREPTKAAAIRHRAALGLVALDPSLRPKVPQLLPLFNEPKFRKDVALVLASLGPQGVEPLHAEIRTNGASLEALYAIWALAKFPTNAQPVIPEILAGLTNHTPLFSDICPWALTRIGRDPELAVEALTTAANDVRMRPLCLEALGFYGLAGKSAVPFLLDLLHTEQRGSQDYTNLVRTLRAIDAQAAARGGRENQTGEP